MSNTPTTAVLSSNERFYIYEVSTRLHNEAKSISTLTYDSVAGFSVKVRDYLQTERDPRLVLVPRFINASNVQTIYTETIVNTCSIKSNHESDTRAYVICRLKDDVRRKFMQRREFYDETSVSRLRQFASLLDIAQEMGLVMVNEVDTETDEININGLGLAAVMSRGTISVTRVAEATIKSIRDVYALIDSVVNIKDRDSLFSAARQRFVVEKVLEIPDEFNIRNINNHRATNSRLESYRDYREATLPVHPAELSMAKIGLHTFMMQTEHPSQNLEEQKRLLPIHYSIDESSINKAAKLDGSHRVPRIITTGLVMNLMLRSGGIVESMANGCLSTTGFKDIPLRAMSEIMTTINNLMRSSSTMSKESDKLSQQLNPATIGSEMAKIYAFWMNPNLFTTGINITIPAFNENRFLGISTIILISLIPPNIVNYGSRMIINNAIAHHIFISYILKNKIEKEFPTVPDSRISNYEWNSGETDYLLEIYKVLFIAKDRLPKGREVFNGLSAYFGDNTPNTLMGTVLMPDGIRNLTPLKTLVSAIVPYLGCRTTYNYPTSDRGLDVKEAVYNTRTACMVPFPLNDHMEPDLSKWEDRIRRSITIFQLGGTDQQASIAMGQAQDLLTSYMKVGILTLIRVFNFSIFRNNLLPHVDGTYRGIVNPEFKSPSIMDLKMGLTFSLCIDQITHRVEDTSPLITHSYNPFTSTIIFLTFYDQFRKMMLEDAAGSPLDGDRMLNKGALISLAESVTRKLTNDDSFSFDKVTRSNSNDSEIDESLKILKSMPHFGSNDPILRIIHEHLTHMANVFKSFDGATGYVDHFYIIKNPIFLNGQAADVSPILMTNAITSTSQIEVIRHIGSRAELRDYLNPRVDVKDNEELETNMIRDLTSLVGRSVDEVFTNSGSIKAVKVMMPIYVDVTFSSVKQVSALPSTTEFNTLTDFSVLVNAFKDKQMADRIPVLSTKVHVALNDLGHDLGSLRNRSAMRMSLLTMDCGVKITVPLDMAISSNGINIMHMDEFLQLYTGKIPYRKSGMVLNENFDSRIISSLY